jgi:hypothetical protein
MCKGMNKEDLPFYPVIVCIYYNEAQSPARKANGLESALKTVELRNNSCVSNKKQFCYQFLHCGCCTKTLYLVVTL